MDGIHVFDRFWHTSTENVFMLARAMCDISAEAFEVAKECACLPNFPYIVPTQNKQLLVNLKNQA